MDSEEISNVILSPTLGARKILQFFDTFWIIDGFLSTLRKENPLPFVLGEPFNFQYSILQLSSVYLCVMWGDES